MPRPTPLSKNDAEREKLNVIIHWYWVQTLVAGSEDELVEEGIPRGVQLGKGVVDSLYGREAGYRLTRLGFVDKCNVRRL